MTLSPPVLSAESVDHQPQLLTVAQVAARLGVRRRVVSDLLYDGKLPDGVSILVGDRQLISTDALEVIGSCLRRCGKLPPLVNA